jgi:hypothetical protein
MSLGNNYAVTLGGSRTFDNPTNIVAGQSGTLASSQDATGSRVPSFGSYFKFAGDVVPTASTAANAIDIYSYYNVSTTHINMVLVSKGSA